MAHDAAKSDRRVTLAEATRFWLKLGFISFGGPAGQIAIVHRELVERRRWIGEERFLHALNFCMLLPGPEAMQLVTYIGWLMHRTPGGIIAGALFVLPSVFLLLALSYVYAAYGEQPAVAAVVWGFKPVVVAIVVEAVVRISRRALKARGYVIIAGAAFVAIYLLHVPFPLIVLLAAVAGLAGPRWLPRLFSSLQKPLDAARAGEAKAAASALPLVIRDEGPPPEHTRPSRSRLATVLVTGLVLWLAPLLAVGLWKGWTGLHVHEYLFFTKAAFVTFGGAYAVLAYVTQVVVIDFGWITKTQAVDGLALAETTPGPLIMVLQFIGFMAGWNNPGELTPLASGVLGALLTTWATFLPCFLFIFSGAPYIETMRGNRSIGSALSGVTAAVVGVILNLALVFGAAVMVPAGWSGSPDWFAVALAIAAFVALERLKMDVTLVILFGGIIGIVRWVAG
jgi:chromate transporter